MDPRQDENPDLAPREDDHDVALLTRIAVQRDKDALAELYRLYFHPLQRFVYRLTGDLDLAQEAINDVMLVVWNSADRFAGRSKVSTWIMGIAYRRGLKLAERSRRWQKRFKSAEFSEVIEPTTGSEEPTAELTLRDLLARALESLSPNHRAVVELTYFHGYSYEDIAAIMECPVNTVKTRMFHARIRLKEIVPALGRDELAR